MSIAPGQTILNKYHVLKLLGEGGSGRVWLAEEITFSNRQVAIKEQRADLPVADVAEVQRYYQQELETYDLLKQESASNLVQIFRVEQYDNRLLVVMAYMPGGDLANMLHYQRDLMPIDQIVKIVRDILVPLQIAHNHPRGIVHRDIKPQNILFDAVGKAHLGDWGLAQLPGVSERSRLSARPHPGSPLYMAPEQARSTDYLTPRADIYAVGCVLFEMLTGKRYKNVRPGTTAGSLWSDVPTWLDQVISKALAEDPFDRYEDAGTMLAALTLGPSTMSTIKPMSTLPGRWAAISRVIMILLAVGLLYWLIINVGPRLANSQTATATALATSTKTPIQSTPIVTVTVAITSPTTGDVTTSTITTGEVTATQAGTTVPTAKPTIKKATLTITNDLVNVRNGPGTDYSLVGSVNKGQQFDLLAKNPQGDWWQICCVNSQQVWIFGQLVKVENTDNVAAVQPSPPPPTSTPVPQPTATATLVTPQPAKSNYKFNVAIVRRCEPQAKGNWFEGTTYVHGQPQSGYKIVFSYAPDGSWATAPVISGPHQGYPGWRTGYYSHIIHANEPQAGDWYVWIVADNGLRISEIAHWHSTGPGEGCNQAEVDFDEDRASSASQPTLTPRSEAKASPTIDPCATIGGDGCKWRLGEGPYFASNIGELDLQFLFIHRGNNEAQGSYFVVLLKDGAMLPISDGVRSIALNKNQGTLGEYNYEYKIPISTIPGNNVGGNYVIYVLDGNGERDSENFSFTVPDDQGKIWMKFDQG